MKHESFLGVSLCLVVLSACSTAKIEKSWSERQARSDYQKEKATFKERMGGKLPCFKEGVYDFTLAGQTPSESCLYPPSPYVYTYDQDQGYYVGQAAQRLNVLQTMPKGFLVKATHMECIGGRVSSCYEQANPNVIFVHMTNEKGVVDGAFLDQKSDGALYEYTGPFVYESTFGTKTVYSFRRVPSEKIRNALKDLTVYDVDQEMFAEVGAWRDLDKVMEKKTPAK